MSRLNPEPSLLTQSSQRCEGAALRNWKYAQTHHKSSARAGRESPKSPWAEKGLHIWTHVNFTHLPRYFTASDLNCLTSNSRSHRISNTVYRIQVEWMLNVKVSVHINPTQLKELRGSPFDLGVSDWKHAHAHIGEAIQSHFAECVIKEEQKRQIGLGCRWPRLYATGALFAYLNSAYPGLFLASSLHPPE